MGNGRQTLEENLVGSAVLQAPNEAGVDLEEVEPKVVQHIGLIEMSAEIAKPDTDANLSDFSYKFAKAFNLFGSGGFGQQ